jgi:GNAT superfamily N-acetyltransferase
MSEISVEIRPATQDDMPGLKLAGLKRIAPLGEGVVAIVSGEFVGYAVCDAATQELTHIIVHPDFHRRGIGRQLISSFSVPIKRVKVIKGRDTPKAFYLSLGFVDTGEVVFVGSRKTELQIYQRD